MKRYEHPRPARYRLEQRFALLLLGLIVFGIVGQLALALLLHGFLFFLTALTLLAFVPFILMMMSVTPPLTLDGDGLTIHPWWWRSQHIPWQQVLAFKPYPMLPRAEQETERRALQGRKRYQTVEGMMLVVTGLPWQYRCAGFFTGEKSQPVIAVTSRTHQGYTPLVAEINQALKASQQPITPA